MLLKNESWTYLEQYLHRPPLSTLSSEILPECSYQPSKENIFRVFNMPVYSIKVVILGQDPYPTPGNAIGYSFVNGRDKKPVSLRNIEKEIKESDPEHMRYREEIDMKSWTDQGVFLLNTALTVETGNAGSHLKYWKDFTTKVISFISSVNPCIWVMWGKKAQKFIPYIQGNNMFVDKYDREMIGQLPLKNRANFIFEAPHPAAEAYAGGKAGFFGSDQFFKINRVLMKLNNNPIIW